MYHIFFIHSSFCEHLGCVHVLAIVNSQHFGIWSRTEWWEDSGKESTIRSIWAWYPGQREDIWGSGWSVDSEKGGVQGLEMTVRTEGGCAQRWGWDEVWSRVRNRSTCKFSSTTLEPANRYFFPPFFFFKWAFLLPYDCSSGCLFLIVDGLSPPGIVHFNSVFFSSCLAWTFWDFPILSCPEVRLLTPLILV